jgi:hypothetical protein
VVTCRFSQLRSSYRFLIPGASYPSVSPSVIWRGFPREAWRSVTAALSRRKCQDGLALQTWRGVPSRWDRSGSLTHPVPPISCSHERPLSRQSEQGGQLLDIGSFSTCDLVGAKCVPLKLTLNEVGRTTLSCLANPCHRVPLLLAETGKAETLAALELRKAVL